MRLHFIVPAAGSWLIIPVMVGPSLDLRYWIKSTGNEDVRYAMKMGLKLDDPEFNTSKCWRNPGS